MAMEAAERVEHLRLELGRLRRSRSVLLRLLEDSLKEQESMQEELRRLRQICGVSNVRQLLPGSAQEPKSRP